MLSGIVFINCKGLRWSDVSREYRPPKSLYNRWKWWRDMGVFARIMAVTVRARMGADDVLEALYPLLLRHGTPEYIRSDNVLCREDLAI